MAKAVEKPSSEVQAWLDCIKSYETEFAKWEKRSRKILKRYRDEQTLQNRDNPPTHFNILWSNVQTLIPATFARMPKPDVSRRYSDRDPVGRVAALILERALDFEINHYTDYRTTLKACVQDRFLGGRGTAWARYEPHMRAAQMQAAVDGEQTTEDVDAPGEELDYECAPVDYVHWNDFGHTVARTWEEVPAVWRRVFMTRDAMVERFGEEKAKGIPLDATPEELKRSDRENPELADQKKAAIYEIWDKTKKEAIWLSKSVKADPLDKLDAAALTEKGLAFEEFFPCPRPLFATMTNDSLVPVPDFALYQDQAESLDLISDRIDGLIKALQVKGVYDGSLGHEIARLFTDASNTDLRAIKNWQNFAEKNGLKGAIDLVDLTPIANALSVAYEAMDQQMQQVYNITGISDIIRGQTEAQETATAQQIKGQYAGLRLKETQQSVAIFATDLLRLKAQIVAGFDDQTLLKIAAVDQLQPADQALVPQAIALLKDKPLRTFRVEIAADSLVMLDEQEEKENRVEFLTALGAFLDKSVQAAAVAPAIVPLLGELMKFGVQGFKVGRNIEGTIDQMLEEFKQSAGAPPVDPAAMQEQAMQQAKNQVAVENAQKEVGLNKRAADLDIREMKFNAEKQIYDHECEMREQMQKRDEEYKGKEQEMQAREQEFGAKELEYKTTTDLAAKEKDAAVADERIKAAKQIEETQQVTTDELQQAVQAMVQAITQTQEQLAELAKVVAADRESEIVVGPDGKKRGVSRVKVAA